MKDRQFGRVRFISGDNKGRYPFSHALYVTGEKTRIVIDPACSLDKLNRLRDIEGVDAVWLSHWHEDHIRYLNLFADCPLWISERDFPPLTDLDILLDWYSMGDETQRVYWKKTMLEEFNYQPRRKARFIEDDETIDLGSLAVQVIATPGHTPGHLSFFFPEEEILFLGDYDLTTFGPWYGDALSSIEDTITSIHRLQAIPARRWITSHNTGLFEENPGQLWMDYENVIFERNEKVLAFLREPRTMEMIASAWLIYGKPREPKEFFEFNERILVGKHLEYLLQRGKIMLDTNRYVTV
jgi:glyoxylase-like metal-dependent hydrolase (beta-lactamase superfamily II)